MTIARIEDNAVVETRALSISDVPVHKRSLWLPVEGDEPSYDPAAEVISGPTLEIEETRVLRVWDVRALTKSELNAHAAEKRRVLANGSATIDVGERSIPTWVDPESRGAITGLTLALNFVPELSAPWKGSDGNFYTLTAAEIPALALGMMQFVQDCFATEAAVLAEIDAETITTTTEIDAADWPT